MEMRQGRRGVGAGVGGFGDFLCGLASNLMAGVYVDSERGKNRSIQRGA
jgi:hypothetical protein